MINGGDAIYYNTINEWDRDDYGDLDIKVELKQQDASKFEASTKNKTLF
jgi:hypothetical protein